MSGVGTAGPVGTIGTGSIREDASPSRFGAVGYAVLLAGCAALSLGWLAVGAAVAVATYVPGVATTLATAADGGDLWARGVLQAGPHSEPLGQVLVDYTFSLVSLVVAVVLLVTAGHSWSVRLLALAMVGSAGTFTLQAHAASAAVQTATGLAIGGVHQVVLHGVACAAYILALLVFPVARRDAGARAGLAPRHLLVAATVATLLVVGFGTALLPHTASCVLFFGFLVPLAGLAALSRRIRDGATAEQRTQARLLFSVLVASLGVATALALTTLVLWWQGEPGLMLTDPATPGAPRGTEPAALLFWFARFTAAAIAVAALVAIRRTRLWRVERVFSRGLVAVLTVALLGGGFVIVRALAPTDSDNRHGVLLATILATVVVALAFLPLRDRIEPLVDRLLHGVRPTPYSVLAGITAMSRSTPGDAPDLARIAEAVGRGLGATACRLTVVRPGLRDRTYAWAGSGTDPTDDLVAVPVRQGEERIGTLSVDRGAVAGLQAQRDHLLEDVADSLGVVLQASRSGIELERQLRAALAHAAAIAQSRRQAVAEMDSERRRIERDLHDGAQHHLVSLRLTLGLVEHLVSTGQLDRARGRLDQVTEQIGTTEAVLAETATGVSSPMLAEHGLVRTLDAELSGGHPPVTLDSDGVGPDRRFPADIEAAVYFCCLESVNNARKHAPGAAVGVRVATVGGDLHFVVRDEGPGWDQKAASGSPGRGLRNVTARIAAVGGRIAIRSAPGAGTTVEGSVPLPAGSGTGPDTPGRALAGAPGHGVRAPTGDIRGGPAADARPLPAREPMLLDQVRDGVRAARELYHGSAPGELLRRLAERLDAPLQVAVVGAPGAGTSTLVAALTDPDATAMTLLDAPAPAGERPRGLPDPDAADAGVVLVRHGHPDDVGLFEVLHPGGAVQRPAATIGVLARADELGGSAPDALEQAERAAAEWAAEPGVSRFCPIVVPVSALLAVTGAALRDDEYRLLARLGEQDAEEIRRLTCSADPFVAASGDGDAAARRELLDRFGLFGVRWSIGLIRDGRAPAPEALAQALVEHSGVPRLRELIDARFARRADAWKARSALLILDALVRASPQAADARPLLYRLERIRSGAHELTEIDLVDALHAGGLDLADDARQTAERLLGASGIEPRARLGLAGDAGPQEVAAAAAAQLEYWQRRAAHPVAGKGERDAASVLVRTCEQLLARAAAG
ncbi:ATP-binding protein [Pseudonocardia acidicola]|uniref:Histidine kinase/HSP90-like ATPase domain-containing protein n=1 Tax=Pseudonocardia acidicola TaxID=2724939 RepID=A0ABX1SJG9_9PSEU|nr:ATP-binding protein [Pseudonocardia acidicola]NMI01724.1 hypothetical protein [Pseudonocardia acidicola]